LQLTAPDGMRHLLGELLPLLSGEPLIAFD
jgi:hypothetical protein